MFSPRDLLTKKNTFYETGLNVMVNGLGSHTQGPKSRKSGENFPTRS